MVIVKVVKTGLICDNCNEAHHEGGVSIRHNSGKQNNLIKLCYKCFYNKMGELTNEINS